MIKLLSTVALAAGVALLGWSGYNNWNNTTTNNEPILVQGTEKIVPTLNSKSAHDKKPSSTLYFTYMTFMLAFIANICLLIHDVFIGTYVAIGFWALALVFYLIRRIDTFRVDIDDGEVMLKSGKEELEDKEEKQTRSQLGEHE